MKKILVIGAGRSATSLINYLLEHAGHDGFGVVVVDIDVNLAREKVGDRSGATVFQLNIDDASQRRKFISDSDIVISMLPPALHYPVALDCLDLGRHMLTASYLSEEIAHLDSEDRDKNLLFMTEMGLDPGIDHMSARRLIAEINDKSGMISAFSSYT
ncbi:MAG: saccharopine dehydrogenase, partial [Saprospiraceae bacterium]|nr:saccharopine dehydrogenase [Saprospiraceae bacterium]